MTSAQVVMRSGATAGDVNACAKWFSDRGFDVGPAIAGSFSITESGAAFERVFKCRLVTDAKGTRISKSTSAKSYELPLSALPSDVQSRIEAVTFTPPPAFGPGNP